MTATVETVSEQLDLAAIIPAEKVVSAVARAITLTETDVGRLVDSNGRLDIFFNHSSNWESATDWRKRRTRRTGTRRRFGSFLANDNRKI